MDQFIKATDNYVVNSEAMTNALGVGRIVQTQDPKGCRDVEHYSVMAESDQEVVSRSQ